MSTTNDAIVNIDGPTSAYEEKKGRITIQETEVPSSRQSPSPNVRPHLQRRMSSFRILEEENLTKFGRYVYKLLEHPFIRYGIYILPVAALLSIPLALFATKYRSSRIDGISTLGLFVWLEVMWVSLWVSKMLAKSFPYIFQGAAGMLHTGIRKYALMLRAVEVPMSLFFWTLFGIATLSVNWTFDKNYYEQTRHSNVPWIGNISKAIRASIASSAILLAEKVFIQLISVEYHGKQHHDKIKEIKYTSKAVDFLYEASLKIYEMHHPAMCDEDYTIHDTANMQQLLKQYTVDRRTQHVFGELQYFGEKLVSLFGRMASDITGTELLRPTSTHSIVDAALERKAGAEALARRIYKSLVKPGESGIFESDIIQCLGEGSEKEAAWIFAQLDRDGNGDVSLEEMILLVCGISQQRKDMWRSACNIRDAIKVLDHVFSFGVLVVVALVYSAFYSSFLSNHYTQIITLMSAGAFSLGQTVGEFNAACILVFVKHPFDVGDRVNMNGGEYEVVRISLLYTVFRSVDTDTISQVANGIVGNLWIDNISRSKAMKERYQFSVSPATTFSELEILRAELEAFVRAPENKRDYQQEVDIQLLSVGDLKQLDLRVEIRHKSNWAIDSLRAYRRSKFMCALLSAMRKVPIDGPAGSAPAQGSMQAPNFSVAISNEQAKAARAALDAATKAHKFIPEVMPNVHIIPSTDGQGSSGLEILPSHRTFAQDIGMIHRDEGLFVRKKRGF